jgi:hypothetical protein
MSAATDGYVPVRGRGGMLRLTGEGWRYYAAEESLRAEPIGDPLRCMVLTLDEVKRYFGKAATFDGFEVVA